MKNLYLLRHATAEDSAYSPIFKDIERELISKGIMESARMGKFISENDYSIQKIYFSPSARTLGTAKIIAEQTGLEENQLETVESLYGSGPRAYLALINSLTESQNDIMIVGHNPDITFFAEYLTRDDIGGNMKKCTFIHFQFEDLKWSEISQKSGNIVKRVDVKTLE